MPLVRQPPCGSRERTVAAPAPVVHRSAEQALASGGRRCLRTAAEVEDRAVQAMTLRSTSNDIESCFTQPSDFCWPSLHPGLSTRVKGLQDKSNTMKPKGSMGPIKASSILSGGLVFFAPGAQALQQNKLSASEALAIATDAYVYSYSLAWLDLADPQGCLHSDVAPGLAGSDFTIDREWQLDANPTITAN